MNRKWWLALLAVLCIFVGCAAGALAAIPLDAGNEVDYGGGGGGWDSGGWDSGGWDSDDDDGGGGIIFFGSGGGRSGGMGTVIVVVVIVAIVVAAVFKANKHSARTGGRPVSAGLNPGNHEAAILPAITAVDPNFSKDAFLGFAKEVYMTLQQAWTERDWEKIRPFEKEELYRQHELQLQEYVRNGQINVVERINVNQAYLHKYERDRQYEYLTVCLKARFNDYVVDEKTRAVLKGDPNREIFMQYLMTFMRKTGVRTAAAEGGQKIVSCPNCGAPVNITSSGRCEYCDFIITTGEHDWVLSVYHSVKPGVALDERGVILRDDEGEA